LSEQVEKGQWFLPGAPTHRRETIVTSPLKAIPQYLVIIPGPSWWHVVAAVFTAALFLCLTVKLVLPAAIFGVIALAGMLRWVWELDKGPDHEPVDVGGGLKLPVYMLGNKSHAIWATWVLIVVIGMIFSCMVFSYLYLWSVQPDHWPPADTELPGLFHTTGVLLLLAGSGGLLLLADHMLTGGRGKTAVVAPLLGALLLLASAIAGDIWLWTRIGLWPSESGFAAATHALGFLNGQNLAMMTVMAGLLAVRILAGRTDKVRRLSFDTMRLLWFYTIGQATVAVIVAHGFPRLVS
jgi:cytochrome c oxidase subunit I+III